MFLGSESENDDIEGKEDDPQQFTNGRGPGTLARVTTDVSVFENYPSLVESYVDPTDQSEHVLLSVCLPGIVDKVNLDLNDDGRTAIVTFNWPTVMYKADELFPPNINKYDPRVTAFLQGLEKTRSNVDTIPQGKIKVTLPFEVQTGQDNYKQKGRKGINGTMVVLGHFKAIKKEYAKKVTKTEVIFD